jgi:FixJ family two-component response regulator
MLLAEAPVFDATAPLHPPRYRDASIPSASAADPPVTAIVDDDPSVRRALQRVVEAGGYTAHTFASAHEFLDSLPRCRVACLVLDIYLGGMSGFDLQKRLVADGVRIPVILITARDDATTRQRIEKSGAAGSLRKPFDGQTLLDAIGRAIGSTDEGRGGRPDPGRRDSGPRY